VNGRRVRAAGAEEIVGPRRLIGRFWAANFTVRRPLTMRRRFICRVCIGFGLLRLSQRCACRAS
jgi:hypothetical protein